MRPKFSHHRKLQAGDRVAIVSPSFAAPALFGRVHERALAVLREELQLEPVEYPTTRQLNASPQDRAADLVSAFTDPTIRAILATIGGDDQLTVLPFLNPVVIQANPKAFFGYSDNTNLLNWLWTLGIVGYHGGSTMVHLGQPGGAHPVSLTSLRSALFDTGPIQLTPTETFCEDDSDWNQDLAVAAAPTRPSPQWTWHNPNKLVTGPSWGGNLEILHWNLAADRWIRPVEDYAGCVLLLETSEEMPTAQDVFRMLRNAGERGLLQQFPAVLVGLAKAANLQQSPGEEFRAAYRRDQQAAIRKVFEIYNPDAMIVFDIPFGHTDPQLILPYGGEITVDGPARSITYNN